MIDTIDTEADAKNTHFMKLSQKYFFFISPLSLDLDSQPTFINYWSLKCHCISYNTSQKKRPESYLAYDTVKLYYIIERLPSL